MSPLVRLLLIWLLALALPAQGVAAATMQFCGPGHQPQAALLSAAVADHHRAMGHATAAVADTAAQPAAPGALAQPGKFKCSARAACCMATALPAPPLMLPVVKPAVERAIVLASIYTGPYSAGLERPPKLSLA